MKPMRVRPISLCLLALALAFRPQPAFPADDGSSLAPRMVMIIRHAEKPDPTGGVKDPNLSPKGYERADALATVIPDHFPRPDFLFATARTKGSNRPVETITPLAKALHESIDSSFKDDDIDELAHDLLKGPKYAGKVVLIAWHHEKIPALAKALGASDAPDKWGPDVFDRVWEITYDGRVASFANVPEKALPGDSQN